MYILSSKASRTAKLIAALNMAQYPREIVNPEAVNAHRVAMSCTL